MQDDGREATGGDDKIPLFLSDPEGVPRADEFMPRAQPPRRRSPVVATGLAAVATVAVAATVYAAVGHLPFSSAPASDARVAPVMAAAASVAPPPVQEPRSAPPPVKAAVQPVEPPRPAESTANASAPSHEALVAAYQSALQSQGRTSPPPPQAAPAAPAATAETPAPHEIVHRLPPDEIASLVRRGSDLIASRDIAAARLALRRAADAGDARAATRLADTYDAAFLARLGVRSVMADEALARSWREKAAQFGAADARSAQRP